MQQHVYMFPGQGSQKTGMGKELFSQFKQETEQANEIAGFNIEEICTNPEKTELLNNTKFTQPALFWTNALFFLKKKSSNELPQSPIFIGHSLGEYNALHAAQVLELFDGLKAVTQRGKLMAKAGDETPGAMAAVLGISTEKVENVCLNTQKNIDNSVYIANINTTGQIVVSSTVSGIKEAEASFLAAGAKRYIPLKVSGAFHSPLMQSAANQYNNVLQAITFHMPQYEVYSNVSANPHEMDAQTIKNAMVEQLCSGVRWHETLLNLKKKYALQNENFTELGPGNVLTGLLRKA